MSRRRMYLHIANIYAFENYVDKYIVVGHKMIYNTISGVVRVDLRYIY